MGEIHPMRFDELLINADSIAKSQMVSLIDFRAET
jgi:hypothetical protein